MTAPNRSQFSIFADGAPSLDELRTTLLTLSQRARGGPARLELTQIGKDAVAILREHGEGPHELRTRVSDRGLHEAHRGLINVFIHHAALALADRHAEMNGRALVSVRWRYCDSTEAPS